MRVLSSLAAFTSLAFAAAVPVEHEAGVLDERDSACTNGPYTRACWKGGYSIATDFDLKHPTTGNTVTYNLEITNGTCNPDGHGTRLCFLINGQYPGPMLVAEWGDMVVVNVQNNLQHNGTSIHWHGVRQLNSVGSDGVGGLTQCPIAPGTSMTYKFQATQFGTSWYHSHYSSQYGDGVVGPLIINGPASANYDYDLGPYMLSDWYYQTAFQVNALTSDNLQSGSPPPNADNLLINGTNKNAQGGGSYGKVTMTPGKKYRLRLVNTSVDNYIRVSLDSHTMTVMTSDFIPIKPFTAEWILLGIGQRYDVVITANQAASNYWFRAQTASDCLSGNNFYGRSVFSYDGVSVSDPTSSPFTMPTNCQEPGPLAPYWKQPVPSGTFSSNADSLNVGLTQAQIVPGGDTIVVWALNQSSIDIAWDKPTLSYVMEGNTSYPSHLNIIPTVSSGNWNYWLIQQGPRIPPIPHPIHLHGHDYFVLGQGSGTFDASTANLNYATPPRRDTATVYSGGWLALAFVSNNPGSWLMHCHIAWHISEGLGIQFLEAPAAIPLPDQPAYDNVCNAWKRYEQTAYYKKIDSGL